MRRLIRTSAIAAPLALALAISPALGQGREPVTDGCDPSAAGVEACTRLLELQARDATRRKAVALTLRALAFKARGDAGSALADFRQAIETDPGLAEAHAGRADLLREAGKCAEAVADYDQAIRLKDDSAANHVGRAFCRAGAGATDAALADLDAAIRLDPDNAAGQAALAFAIKARLVAAAGRPEAATAALDQAIRFAPGHPTLLVERAALLAELGQDDRALADLAQAVGLDAANKADAKLAALQLRAGLHVRRGDLDAAIADQDAVVALDPQRAQRYAARASLWRLKGRLDRAVADYDRALELDPAGTAVYAARADLHRAAGSYDLALADYDKVVEKRADDAGTRENRGLIRFYRGQFAGAAEDFRKVAEAKPTAYAALWLHLAQARAGRKDARDGLAKAAARLKSADWPAPVIQAFLGRQGVDATHKAAGTPEQQCEARFYAGQWHLLRAEREEARTAFEDAIAACPRDFVEYRGATEELKRLPPPPLPVAAAGPVAAPAAPAPVAVATAAEAAAQAPRTVAAEPPAPAPAASAPAPVQAAALPAARLASPMGRRVALVIGNGSYKAVAALHNPKRDARTVAAALQSVGFQTVTVEDDATRARMIAALRTFAEEADKADWAMIYYAGHGIEVGGVNYLVPVDARLRVDRDAQDEAVPLDRVLQAIEGARKLRLVVLDACRDNPFLVQMRRTTAMTRSLTRGLGSVDPEGGTLVAYSAKHGQVALDGDGVNSPFVTALVKHLRTPNVEISKLFRLVRDDVLAATGRQQEPFIYGSLPGEDFYFLRQ